MILKYTLMILDALVYYDRDCRCNNNKRKMKTPSYTGSHWYTCVTKELAILTKRKKKKQKEGRSICPK